MNYFDILNHVLINKDFSLLLSLPDNFKINYKYKIKFIMLDEFQYIKYAPCNIVSLKKFYYNKLSLVKNEDDARFLFNHFKNLRKSSLNKLLKNKDFMDDFIEGLTFGFSERLIYELKVILDDFNYQIKINDKVG